MQALPEIGAVMDKSDWLKGDVSCILSSVEKGLLEINKDNSNHFLKR